MIVIVSRGLFESISIPAVGVWDRTGDIRSRASFWSLFSLKVRDLVVRA